MNTALFNKLMKQNGYTNDSFAEALNMSRSSLFRKKMGLTEFTYLEVERCCELLHIKDKATRKAVFFAQEVS